jgi:hypothetical protein
MMTLELFIYYFYTDIGKCREFLDPLQNDEDETIVLRGEDKNDYFIINLMSIWEEEKILILTIH